jgi:phage FluMu protein Com
MGRSVKMEKKCPKCKAVNVVTFVGGEISINCNLHPGNKKEGYTERIEEGFY